jgi:hypothetical protein
MPHIDIRFETAADMPPPFSFFYHLILEEKDGKYQAELEWKYLHREDLTPEEIEEEGFTGQDDFSWKGEVPPILFQTLSQLFATETLGVAKENLRENENYLVIRLSDGQKNLTGTPRRRAEAEFRVQEVIQGIYETAGKESPLQVYLLKKNKEISQSLSLTVSFAKREATLEAGERKQISTDWQQIQAWMELVFGLEYLPEKATDAPQTTGLYIDPGEGIWYEWGRAVKAVGGKKETLAELEKLFSGLTE